MLYINFYDTYIKKKGEILISCMDFSKSTFKFYNNLFAGIPNQKTQSP